MQVHVRSGVKKDLPQVFELIKELAAYERAPEEVTNSVAKMEEDGFGELPAYRFFVAERNDLIIGISLYYFRYSTWKGRRLFLEDIIVTAAERRKGVGRALFENTMKKALEERCSGMMWQVLNWNDPAMKFYEQYGNRVDSEWVNCSLEADQIAALMSNKKA
jgi:GNAT superfamily N-acetyltransferase